MTNKPKVIIGPDVGINLNVLDSTKHKRLKELLTVTSKAWKDNPAVTVEGFYERDGYLWVPRQFALDIGFKPDLDTRSSGLPQDLTLKATLDPKRGQTAAVPDMVNHIRKHGDGILIAPTGIGKTLLSYAIASHFKCSIGVLLYAGHMFDNWVEQADKAFGVKPEDIGIIQQGKMDIGKPITLISIQSLLARDYPAEVLDQFGFIIADELQRYGAEKWGQVVRKLKARYKLGMSADPSRPDGLEKVIAWNFGSVGHTIDKITVQMTVAGMHIQTDYPPNAYKDWKRSNEKGEFVGDAMRYDKQLAKDSGRNRIITELLIDARQKKRCIIVFSRFRKHLTTLKTMLDLRLEELKDTDYPATKTAYLVGGMKKKERDISSEADILFSTYSYARDALNNTSLDTEFFATPPGNPLQPAGRLRDKGSSDRNPLLLLDLYEDNDYSKLKWNRRREFYESRKYTIKLFKKKP